MKYVRTKDDFIYKITTRDFGIFVIDEKGNLIGRIDADEIINQTDTIEELCDEFVIKYESKDKVSLFDICNNFEATKEEYNNYQTEYKNANIYGAIWTDKGLIYVAKMNDKGELELV